MLRVYCKTHNKKHLQEQFRVIIALDMCKTNCFPRWNNQQHSSNNYGNSAKYKCTLCDVQIFIAIAIFIMAHLCCEQFK